eukprot:TRINITY_DN14173_c0_g1_i1.p1 TRINITY_DN14173_c0_g1~~TRINITY_DN14173_c0_g1_i1.p1  ORF type:complete len:404 (+),score=95.25 TRINITY_DN14173_c0_g1_i1:277-1488(+)
MGQGWSLRIFSKEGGGASELSKLPSSAFPRRPARKLKLKDLQVATAYFSSKRLLGEGSFGKVYLGYLDDRTHAGVLVKRRVAVKKLSPESFQGYEEWLGEVLLLDKFQHENLVQLLGYCGERNEALLVYEFCGGGSLDRLLFPPAESTPGAKSVSQSFSSGGSRSGSTSFSASGTPRGPSRSASSSFAGPLRPHGPLPVVTWEQRMEIAKGTAAGLLCLHERNVIHRDFKASNILLDEDLKAKITDFGLAKAGPDAGKTHVSTRVLGTLGYLDPTYMVTGHLTQKSDVYGYGVLLLELLTGKQTGGDDDGNSLTTWVRPYLTQRRPDLNILVDERLEGQYVKAEATRVALLAKHCIQLEQSERPDMKMLVESLKFVSKSNAKGLSRSENDTGTSKQQDPDPEV